MNELSELEKNPKSTPWPTRPCFIEPYPTLQHFPDLSLPLWNFFTSLKVPFATSGPHFLPFPLPEPSSRALDLDAPSYPSYLS